MKNSILCLLLALIGATAAGCADNLDSLRENLKVSGASTTTLSTGSGPFFARQTMSTGIDL